MKVRRTQYEIYLEILTFCRSQRSFTSIIQRCNLNSKIAQEYLDFLLDKKYLIITGKESKKLYITTEKAQEFLSLFSQLYRKLFETTPEKKF